MTPCHSRRLKEAFSANSRNLTPGPIRQVAHVLFAPLSADLEVTRWCESVLSHVEMARAERFVTPGDRSLFVQRRAFRRFCAGVAVGSSGPLSGLGFEETDKGCPYLASQPGYCFSFSSCRFGFLGAWSSSCGIGVDIEDSVRNPGAIGLARQYFSAAEARAVEGVGGHEGLQAFFRLWCLKEAALKSIGEGMPYGLDAFEFALGSGLQVVHAPLDRGGAESFSGYLVEDSETTTAIVLHS